MATDVRIASTSAVFRAAGISNGLTASELGISYLLPRAIGASRAFEIMLSGRDVDAVEAERIGLVSRTVVPGELLDTCYALAERMISYSRVGIEVTKRLLWSSLDASSLAAHMDHEGHAQLYVRLTTENFEEAIRARKERRPPVYRD
jgi:enoyl-CoA hydratase